MYMILKWLTRVSKASWLLKWNFKKVGMHWKWRACILEEGHRPMVYRQEQTIKSFFKEKYQKEWKKIIQKLWTEIITNRKSLKLKVLTTAMKYQSTSHVPSHLRSEGQLHRIFNILYPCPGCILWHYCLSNTLYLAIWIIYPLTFLLFLPPKIWL